MVSFLRQRKEKVAVSAARLLPFAPFPQPVLCILSHRFQHPVATGEGGQVGDDQALVYEGLQQVQHVGAGLVFGSPYRLRRVQRPTAGEHR
jgi:hypothetical protein